MSAPETTGRGPWWIVGIWLPPAAVLLGRLQVNDLAYQIRAGTVMWSEHAILRADVFTYTIYGDPWLNVQWGAQLLLGATHAAIGWRGLLLLQAVIVGAVYAATFRRSRSLGATPMVASLLTLVGFVTAVMLPGALALRPQLLAAPLFVVAAWVVRGRQTNPRRLWWIPAIGVAWANVHGSFPLLTLLLVAAFAHDLIARAPTRAATGALVAASLVTPLVTPWGADTFGYLVDVSSSPFIRDVIAEWRPMAVTWPAGLVFAVSLGVGATAIARRRTNRLRWDDTIGFLALTLLTIWSARNVLWWSLFVPPAAGYLLAGISAGSAWSRRATALVAASIATLLILGSVRVATTPLHELLTEDATPGITGAVSAATEGGERVFATRWASWFEQALPDVPMFTDARVEVFPDDIWAQYFDVVGLRRNWADVLERWQVSVVVAAREDGTELIQELSGDAAWSLRFEDAEGIVFERARIPSGT